MATPVGACPKCKLNTVEPAYIELDGDHKELYT